MTSSAENKRPREDPSTVDDVEQGEKTSFKNGFLAISPSRRVTVTKFREQVYVNIREFYKGPDGEEKPGKKGISLTIPQWRVIASSVDAINEQIASLSKK